MIHPDDEGFHYSSHTEWDHGEAREVGALHPERAWIVTDRDAVHRNPYYTGPEVPHPDDDAAYDYIDEHGIEAWRARQAEERRNPPAPLFNLDDFPF